MGICCSTGLDLTSKFEKFPPVGKFQAFVTSVYDGDTFWFNCDFGTNNIFSYKARLAHIDAPEMKPLKSSPTRDEEKKKAQEVKEIVEKLILQQYITINSLGLDKYGRVLCEVYTQQNIDLSEYLLKNKLANLYEGGTKIAFGKKLDPIGEDESAS